MHFRWLACAILTVTLPARAAVAQICHAPAVQRTTEVELQMKGATVDSEGTPGSWEGLGLGVAFRAAHVAAHASVAAYRIDVGAAGYDGLGDVAAGGEATLLSGHGASTGVALDVTLPTGSAASGLGMGHAMAMPGAWARARRGRATALAGANLGVALGESHHHMAGVVAVDPMNPIELGGATRLGFDAKRDLTPHLDAAIALPLTDGVTRAIAGGGVTWRSGAWRVGGDLAVALTGNPFRARLVLSLARSL